MVLLPTPLAPTMAACSPGATRKLTSKNNWSAPGGPYSSSLTTMPDTVVHSVGVMCGPNGEAGGDGVGCLLEAVPNRRFVWTTALGPGYQPNPVEEGGFHFTGILEFEPVAGGAMGAAGGTGGTLYRATGRHATQADADQHAAMGFEVGWGLALDQLVALFA